MSATRCASGSRKMCPRRPSSTPSARWGTASGHNGAPQRSADGTAAAPSSVRARTRSARRDRARFAGGSTAQPSRRRGRGLRWLTIPASTTGGIGGHNRRLRGPSRSQDRRRLLCHALSRDRCRRRLKSHGCSPPLPRVTRSPSSAFMGRPAPSSMAWCCASFAAHDLAADVMEDAYLQIWRSAGEFDPAQSAPLAWMVAVARRLAIDVARRPQPATGDGEPEVIDDNEGPSTVPRHQLTDDLKRLLTCIGRLEPDRQRMLLLAYFGAFSREQLAVKLDMPVDLLRASLRRSLARSRAMSGLMSEVDHTDALAAEYVLGTLDFDEREQARALLGSDAAFAAKVAHLGAPARRIASDGGAGGARCRDLGAHQVQDAGRPGQIGRPPSGGAYPGARASRHPDRGAKSGCHRGHHFGDRRGPDLGGGGGTCSAGARSTGIGGDRSSRLGGDRSARYGVRAARQHPSPPRPQCRRRRRRFQ